MSSFISLATALETSIILFTLFKSSSYALVNIVTCEPNCCMFSVKASTCPANCVRSRAYCPGQLPHLPPAARPELLRADLKRGTERETMAPAAKVSRRDSLA